jgi:hypothetical protein
MAENNNIDVSSVLGDGSFDLETSAASNAIQESAETGQADQASINALAAQKDALGAVEADLQALLTSLPEGEEKEAVAGQLSSVSAAYLAVSGALANPTGANVSSALITGSQAYNRSSSVSRSASNNALAALSGAALAYNMTAMAIAQARDIAFYASDFFGGLTEGIQNMIMPEVSKTLDADERKMASIGKMIEENPELNALKEQQVARSKEVLESDTINDIATDDKELQKLLNEAKDLQKDTTGGKKNPDDALLYLENVNQEIAAYEKAVEEGASPEVIEEKKQALKNALKQDIKEETVVQDAIILDAVDTVSLSSEKRFDRDIRAANNLSDDVEVTAEMRMEYINQKRAEGIPKEDQQFAQDRLESRYAGMKMDEIGAKIDATMANWDNLSEEERQQLKKDRDAFATVELAQVITIADTHQKVRQTQEVLDNPEMIAAIKQEITQGRADGTLSAEEIKAIAKANGLEQSVVKDFATMEVEDIRAENEKRMQQTEAEAAKTVNEHNQAVKQIEMENEELAAQGLEAIKINPENIERAKEKMQGKGGDAEAQPSPNAGNIEKQKTVSEFSAYLQDADIGNYDFSDVTFTGLSAEKVQDMTKSNQQTIDALETGEVTFVGASDTLATALDTTKASPEVEKELQASHDFSAMLKGQSFSDGILYAGPVEGQDVTAKNTPTIQQEQQQAAYR